MDAKLIATANALESPGLERMGAWDTHPYVNRRGIFGRYFRFWGMDQHHMISVSNCSRVLTPPELAYLIQRIEKIDEFRFGNYTNRNYAPGFYATAKSTRALGGLVDPWFMISRSPKGGLA